MRGAGKISKTSNRGRKFIRSSGVRIPLSLIDREEEFSALKTSSVLQSAIVLFCISLFV